MLDAGWAVWDPEGMQTVGAREGVLAWAESRITRVKGLCLPATLYQTSSCKRGFEMILPVCVPCASAQLWCLQY